MDSFKNLTAKIKAKASNSKKTTTSARKKSGKKDDKSYPRESKRRKDITDERVEDWYRHQ
jgi:hypothetical protein